MLKMFFFMPMDPPRTTAQTAKTRTSKNGKYMRYKDEKLKDAEQQLYLELAKHKPKEPAKGPVRLTAMWVFRQDRKSLKPKTTRPDTDNLQKMLKDCMTKCGFWKDDALVYDERVLKYWGPEPGIHIRITEESV